MTVLQYAIQLLEPLLATRLQGDPNTGVSYPYIPGSLVRGALANIYQRSHGAPQLNAIDPHTSEMFFNGKTRYLNAYPHIPSDNPLAESHGRRMLPTPFSWQQVKNTTGPIYDFAVQVPTLAKGEPVQYQGLHEDEPFCSLQDSQVVFAEVKRRIAVHTARDRIAGRALEGSGAVYQYDALAPGERFSGIILLDNGDGEEIAELLRQVVTLGGSANGGYGRVAIEDIRVTAASDPIRWQETGGDSAEIVGIPAGTLIAVTLLSDAILRDRDTGAPSIDLAKALRDQLGCNIYKPDASTLPSRRTALRLDKVGGFNRKWSLPLVQTQTLAAGSVLLLACDQDMDAAILQGLAWRGIGERRSEGFGRIAINWQHAAVLRLAPKSKKNELVHIAAPGERRAATPVSLTGDAKRIGTWLAQRLLRQDLDVALQRATNGLDVRWPPSNAQMSRFRVVARSAMSTGDIGRLQDYLESISSRKSSRDQWHRARIGEVRLHLWLARRLGDPTSIWSTLGVADIARRIGDVTAELNDVLAREYTIRLIDAVLAKATQKRRQEEGGEE